MGPVDGNDHIGGNYAAALNLEASLPNLLPENTKTDVSAFLDFGNVWGMTMIALLMIVIKLDLQQVLLQLVITVGANDFYFFNKFV